MHIPMSHAQRPILRNRRMVESLCGCAASHVPSEPATNPVPTHTTNPAMSTLLSAEPGAWGMCINARMVTGTAMASPVIAIREMTP